MVTFLALLSIGVMFIGGLVAVIGVIEIVDEVAAGIALLLVSLVFFAAGAAGVAWASHLDENDFISRCSMAGPVLISESSCITQESKVIVR